MNTTDFGFISTIGVLAAALYTFLLPITGTLPAWPFALVPLVVGGAVFGVRLYVAIVGKDNTTADETLETVETETSKLAAGLGKAGK